MIPFMPGVLAPAGSSLYAEVAQYFVRMTSLDANLRNDIRVLIEGLVDDGIWPQLDKLSVAQTLESDSLLNLKSASHPSVNVGCAFVADQGFTTDFATTAYLRTGFTEDGTTNLGESDSTLFVYNRAASNQGIMMGAYDSSSTPEFLRVDGASNTAGWLQSFTTPLASYTAGFQAASRVDASTVNVCSKRTTATGAHSATTKISPYREFYLGTLNSPSGLPVVGTDWSDGQYAAHGCGAGLAPIDLLKLEARLQTYFTARGTAV